MELGILAFTKRGYELGCRIAEALDGYDAKIYLKGRSHAEQDGSRDEAAAPAVRPVDVSLSEICRDAFEKALPLVFVGASGIAVRSIAPFVRDKLSDPPVIVIDEAGSFVIPLLSGHVGGANELASLIADGIGAVPVITTATDVAGAFPVDLFAKENGLTIMNREGIAKVSASALEGRPVTISIRDYPPLSHVDVLITDAAPEGDAGAAAFKDAASIVLSPKRYALGMGCRRGTSFEDLRSFALDIIRDKGIDLREIGCIATIDIKKDEEGLVALSRAWRLPLITFDAELLSKAEGDFSHSELVLEKTGVDNVCERAAVLAAGAGSRLMVRKHAGGGMTAAVAERASRSRQ